MRDERTKYTIVIQPEASCSEMDSIRGLRWLLKRLLRNYHLRCVEIYESGTDEKVGDDN